VLHKPLLLTFLVLHLASTAIAAAQDNYRYKLGLVLANHDQPNGADILNAATNAFVDTHRFVVVERSVIAEVVTEKILQEFLDGNTNNKLSDTLRLDLLGIVNFTMYIKHKSKDETESTWVIDVRLVDVKTAEIKTTISSERFRLLPATTIREAGRSLFRSIREAFPPAGYVVQVNGKEVIVDLGSAAGLKQGDRLEVFQESKPIIHPVTREVLATPMKMIGELKVTSVSLQMSTCKIKKAQGALRPGNPFRLQANSSILREWVHKLSISKTIWEKKEEKNKE
jgi:hypothetical protein